MLGHYLVQPVYHSAWRLLIVSGLRAFSRGELIDRLDHFDSDIDRSRAPPSAWRLTSPFAPPWERMPTCTTIANLGPIPRKPRFSAALLMR